MTSLVKNISGYMLMSSVEDPCIERTYIKDNVFIQQVKSCEYQKLQRTHCAGGSVTSGSRISIRKNFY